MFSSLGFTEMFSRADTASGPSEDSGTSCETAAVKNYTALREERDSVQWQRRWKQCHWLGRKKTVFRLEMKLFFLFPFIVMIPRSFSTIGPIELLF